MAPKNRYSAIVEAIFHGRYEAGDTSVEFRRDQITAAAKLERNVNLTLLQHLPPHVTPLPNPLVNKGG